MSGSWRSLPKSSFTLIGRGLSFLRWNRASYLLLSLFAATILLIMYVWQPLVRDYLATVDGYEQNPNLGRIETQLVVNCFLKAVQGATLL